MRSRIMGGCALVLGLLFIFVQVMGGKAFELRPFLGGVVFVGLGAYYLITGRRAATSKEFIVEGKLAHEDAPPRPAPNRASPGKPSGGSGA